MPIFTLPTIPTFPTFPTFPTLTVPTFTVPTFTVPTFTIPTLPTVPTFTIPTLPTGPGPTLPAGARVRPGDLISAEFMNQVLARLEALEAALVMQNAMFGPDVAALRLGNQAADTHTLLAVGTGFESGGGIWLDGQSLLVGPPARGITLIVLDADLNMKWRQTYDTFASPVQANQLAADLRSFAARSDLVIGVTHDAYRNQLTAGARAALAAVGAAALGEDGQARDNAAFIGVAPNNQDGASFNFLTSVVPADGAGTGTAQLAALPFAWGLYSRPLRRFLLGGAVSRQPLPSTPTVTFPTQPTLTVTFPTQPTFTATFPTIITQPTFTATFPTQPTFTATFPTIITQPTFTATFPTQPTFAATMPTGITQPGFTAPLVSPAVPVFSSPGGAPGDMSRVPFEPGVALTLPTQVLAEQPTGVVRGIGDRRTERLAAAGIATLGALAAAAPADVAGAAGVSLDTAADYIAEARNLLQMR